MGLKYYCGNKMEQTIHAACKKEYHETGFKQLQLSRPSHTLYDTLKVIHTTFDHKVISL